MEHQSSSYRVYSSQSIAPVALRASCPPPKKGVGWGGILFVVLLGAGLSGATLGAQRFLDRATQQHQPIVAAQSDVTPPPPAAPIADPLPAPSPSQVITAPAPATSSTTVAATKPKHRHHRVRPSASATAATTAAPEGSVEAPPPNPYEDSAPPDLRFIDRGSRSRP